MERPFLLEYWQCNTCGFETFNVHEKEEHLLLFEADPSHMHTDDEIDEVYKSFSERYR